MNKQAKVIAAVVLLVLSGVVLAWHYHRPAMPNEGQAVTVTCPKGHTHERTMQYVYDQGSAGKALMEGGKWMVNCEECGELAVVKKMP